MSQLKSFIRRVVWSRSHFNVWQRLGVNFTKKHFSSPIPDLREIEERPEIWNQSSLAGIDFNAAGQLHLLDSVFPEFKSELNFATEKPKGRREFYRGNSAFSPVDAGVLHCMIRHFKPRKIIEVGAGNSTLVAARASLLNQADGVDTQLTSIEPYPRQYLLDGLEGLSKLIVKKVEDVDNGVFDQLEDGDILFIDSSHVLRIGNDVYLLFLDVLPRLKKGVVVHIHDIFLPYNYPQHWVLDKLGFLNEQYVLQAFLSCNEAFEVLYANYYMSMEFPEKTRFVFGGPDESIGENHSSSFWMRRVKG